MFNNIFLSVFKSISVWFELAEVVLSVHSQSVGGHGEMKWIMSMLT